MTSDVRIFWERARERQRLVDIIKGIAVSWDAAWVLGLAEQSLEPAFPRVPVVA